MVLAGLELIAFLGAAVSNSTDSAGTLFSGALMWGVLGVFLIYRANKRKENAKKREQWENENK